VTERPEGSAATGDEPKKRKIMDVLTSSYKVTVRNRRQLNRRRGEEERNKSLEIAKPSRNLLCAQYKDCRNEQIQCYTRQKKIAKSKSRKSGDACTRRRQRMRSTQQAA
jgi:hypothetical protein